MLIQLLDYDTDIKLKESGFENIHWQQLWRDHLGVQERNLSYAFLQRDNTFTVTETESCLLLKDLYPTTDPWRNLFVCNSYQVS